jgi:Protein of unknown function (DUF3040)
MSLPTGQQRALIQIEKRLADDDPSLGPLFAIFTRLASHEAMPVTERVTAGRWQLRWPRRIWLPVATLVGLAMVSVALFTLSLTVPSSQACPGTAVSFAARLQSVPTERQPACVTQPTKPSESSLNGLRMP